MFKQNVFLIGFYQIFILKDMAKPCYIKGVRKQMFSKVGVLIDDFAKFTGKHLCWSQVLFYDICEILKTPNTIKIAHC